MRTVNSLDTDIPRARQKKNSQMKVVFFLSESPWRCLDWPGHGVTRCKSVYCLNAVFGVFLILTIHYIQLCMHCNCEFSSGFSSEFSVFFSISHSGSCDRSCE